MPFPENSSTVILLFSAVEDSLLPPRAKRRAGWMGLLAPPLALPLYPRCSGLGRGRAQPARCRASISTDSRLSPAPSPHTPALWRLHPFPRNSFAACPGFAVAQGINQQSSSSLSSPSPSASGSPSGSGSTSHCDSGGASSSSTPSAAQSPAVRSGRKGRRRVFSLSEADSHGGHWPPRPATPLHAAFPHQQAPGMPGEGTGSPGHRPEPFPQLQSLSGLIPPEDRTRSPSPHVSSSEAAPGSLETLSSAPGSVQALS
ncbi:hypothetical protein J1605_006137 [Eschrichtius robustus]|uniref:CLEC16A/TT9 C-terminal domain-containing protein n=1 Tax=Eschrichtius robustus TaxID=9764 RepID=A0AB34H2Y3_ESCRO|nr:hypothetical protein J1605_006137 [Eschrichtius robustus]